LKKREDIKRDDDIELKEKGKAELQRIANEIKIDNENKKAKVIEIVLYHAYIILMILCQYI